VNTGPCIAFVLVFLGWSCIQRGSGNHPTIRVRQPWWWDFTRTLLWWQSSCQPWMWPEPMWLYVYSMCGWIDDIQVGQTVA